MLASVWIAIAFVWTAIVFDIVSETAGEDRGIAAFGAVLADPGRTVTLWIVAALVASAVVAMALALGYVWARFRERAIAAQLDARFDRLAAEGIRAVGFIPYVGDYADWLPIPYHFDFVRDGDVLGSHERRTGLFKFRDVYDIDMSGDPQRTLDRRLVLANAVGMDALQAR